MLIRKAFVEWDGRTEKCQGTSECKIQVKVQFNGENVAVSKQPFLRS